ncbi:glutaredoxin family protein [Roseateles chitinivorans]|uniref:glutaredoxin family protein n=1 Tax=Roseateles chitinivorans TaxID=2917965 RepID=UPI003D67912A
MKSRPKWVRLLAELLLIGVILALAVPAGKLAAFAYREYLNRPVSGDYSEYLRAKPQPLSLYGSSTCPACRSAREHLRERGIPFNDLIIDQSAEARAEWERLRQDSVPVFVTRDTLIVGYKQQRLDDLVAAIH